MSISSRAHDSSAPCSPAEDASAGRLQAECERIEQARPPAPDPLAENWELCHECGGLCCCLYIAHDENGEYVGDDWLPAYIDEWLGKFVSSGALVAEGDRLVPGAHGVQPLHDPRLSHLPSADGAAYRANLPEWVDTRKCQFCHPETGCMLPHEYRAPICFEYHCLLWPAG